jgi:hypothetical protein
MRLIAFLHDLTKGITMTSDQYITAIESLDIKNME